MSRSAARPAGVATGVHLVLVACFCAWVLSMPVFPSQDGPLHLYYVNIFRHLLFHQSDVYTRTYFINRYLPPYSLYYYGLIGLGRVVSLEMADKLIVCAYFIVFALGIRSLIRTVSGAAVWAPLLAFPVMLSWPLMMGFVNYALGTGIACFALAVWMRNEERDGWRGRMVFLFLLALVILTHPVPWMFVLGFAFFDLALRLVRMRRREPGSLQLRWRRDLVAAVAGCVGYLYLRHFENHGLTPARDNPARWEGPIATLLHHCFDTARLRGLILFTGLHGGALLYRLGLYLLIATCLGMGGVHLWRVVRRKAWDRSATWASFGILFLLLLPFVPGELNGSYYFAIRLMFLIILSLVIGASATMAEDRALVRLAAGGAAALTLFTLLLAVLHISPAAREIATLNQAPLIESAKHGMLMRPLGSGPPPEMSYEPDYWAGANYFRRHNLVLYNTGWLEIAIIPIKPRPEHFHELDDTYNVDSPMVGGLLLRDDATARRTLSRIGFVLAMHDNAPRGESPFAEQRGSPVAGAFAAGWTCTRGTGWDLCVPPKE